MKYNIERRYAIQSYPDVLNPGDTASVEVSGYNGARENILFLTALLNARKTFIFLKKVEATP